MDLSYFAPSPAQLALAVVCVAVIQKLKIADRFPWLNEITDSANHLASVLLALIATVLFHWRDVLTPNHQATLTTLGKDAALQWGCQQIVYRVGIKNALKTLFTMLGIGPPTQTAVTTTHTTSVADDGSVIRQDMIAKVTLTPPTTGASGTTNSSGQKD